MKPLVSVIIPTYNRKAMLAQAIESVLQQTYPHFEILVIDDGSSDGSWELLQEIQEPRLLLFQQTNSGRSMARNYGLREAHGEYITFLDDDDLFLPNKLQVQVDLLESDTKTGIVAGGWQRIDTSGNVLSEFIPDLQRRLDLHAWLTDCQFIIQSCCIRRAWIEIVNEFDRSIEPTEDWDFYLRLAAAGCPMKWHHDIVTLYRIHGENSMITQRTYLANRGPIMLDKYFAQTESIPPDIQSQRGYYYARWALVRGFWALRLGDISLTRVSFDEAFKYFPSWKDSEFSEFADLTIAYAVDIEEIPLEFINKAFNNMPEQIRKERKIYKRLVAHLNIYNGFIALTDNNRLKARRAFLIGARLYPRWLLNRGILKNLLLSYLPTRC